MSVTDAYRCSVLQQAVLEHEICQAFAALRAANIEPILLKGWSVARHYPDPVARPLGDIDLAVPDEKLSLARQVISGDIDWHTQSALPDGFVRRSRLVPLQQTQVRILSHEDNLHYVAIHLLRHAGWSRKWVKDVAVLLASRPQDFDWKLCEGRDPIRAGWVRAALAVAKELEGANLQGTPAEHHKLPSWVIPVIKKSQRHPDPEDNQPPESIWKAISHPWRLPVGLIKRWPNKLTAAIATGAPLQEKGAWRSQVRYCKNLVARAFSLQMGFSRRTTTQTAQ